MDTLPILSSTITQNFGLISIFLVLTLLCKYYTRNYNYFTKRGVPFLKPQFIIGNWAPRILLREAFHDFNLQIYKKFNGCPYGGYFEGSQPLLLVRDPALIKLIMVKEFEYFTDRNFLNSRPPSYIAKMLINMKGEEWRNVRHKLTHAYTSSKLRGMENLVSDCGKQMMEYLDVMLKEKGSEVEMKDFLGRYSLEVIGCCAFGLSCSSFKDPNAQFVKMASQLMDAPTFDKYVFLLTMFLFPPAVKYMPLSVFNNKVGSYLKDIILKAKEERKKLSQIRNDFLQILLDAAEEELKENSGERVVITDDVVVGQSILFMFAGYETSSSAISFACAELALNPDVQEKLRNEIKRAAETNGGDCSYAVINGMPYLEQVVLETLRKYPPVSRIDRTCTKAYTLPGAEWSLRPEDVIAVPIAGVMNDPQYYPNPEEFDPERFSAEKKRDRPREQFLAWGLGPRNCIGARFGMMSIKFGLFYLLKDFKLSECSKTEEFKKFDKGGFILKSESGTWVNVERAN